MEEKLSCRSQIVKNGLVVSKDSVLAAWQRTAFLAEASLEKRGWLIDVMRCVDRLNPNGFSLNEIYQFEDLLSATYPNNNNVRPKIRQQLQVLRDKGYLEFLGNGRYRIAG